MRERLEQLSKHNAISGFSCNVKALALVPKPELRKSCSDLQAALASKTLNEDWNLISDINAAELCDELQFLSQ